MSLKREQSEQTRKNLENRDSLVEELKREVIGPDPQGEELVVEDGLEIGYDKYYRPYRQTNGEEIVKEIMTTKRYGVGVLYPEQLEELTREWSEDPDSIDTDNRGVAYSDEAPEDQLEDLDLTTQVSTSVKNLAKTKITPRTGFTSEEEKEPERYENPYRRSSMGTSLFSRVHEESTIKIEVDCGRYDEIEVFRVGTKEDSNDSSKRQKFHWYLRRPVKLTYELYGKDLGNDMIVLEPLSTENADGLGLVLEVLCREPDADLKRLTTVTLRNNTPCSKIGMKEYCSVFQTTFKVSVIGPETDWQIFPYPLDSLTGSTTKNEEDLSLQMLYSENNTFAIGHGCGTDWGLEQGGATDWVKTECFPKAETPNIDYTLKGLEDFELPMRHFAGLESGEDGLGLVDRLCAHYDNWIEEQSSVSVGIKFEEAKEQNLAQCRMTLSRIRTGLDYLKDPTNSLALHAFQLANHAILLQQIATSRPTREYDFDTTEKNFFYAKEREENDVENVPDNRGKWRPFQIAFLVMAVPSIAEGDDEWHEAVELIWFPTGGGKTEAYLAAASFSMFLRRLKNNDDVGTEVIMRYTLRLLTAQQFQRATALICAMEYLRIKYEDQLGTEEFSIGIWLGSSFTPNFRTNPSPMSPGAIQVVKGLKQGDRSSKNKLLVIRCPWCAAQIGPPRPDQKDVRQKARRCNTSLAPGYDRDGDTIVIGCNDNSCHFYIDGRRGGLPVYVVDEDIYENRPTLLIGTVDKFAQLSWRHDSRSIFGIGSEGTREVSPPGMIIQDELHMISGPLGSMMGLYETVVDELCTDRRDGVEHRPKIISSTATIRRYKEQVRALFARQDTYLFPPPAVKASDSFFARYAVDETGVLKNPKYYVGVFAPGYGSLQSVQVRVLSSLMQAPMCFPDEIAERDPWWTLMIYFNSFRELGTTISLYEHDLVNYISKDIKGRKGISEVRNTFRWNIHELTGRIGDDVVTEKLEMLDTAYSPDESFKGMDACLATSIIEVGVDIERLSVMCVVGQPNTTSQYIQVTGRIGRDWTERPGVVFTVYNHTSPRDLSHFEKFRSFHENLYERVEPTSVTPFALPVLERALHGALMAFCRQKARLEELERPMSLPEDYLEQFKDIVLERVRKIDRSLERDVEQVFEKRRDEFTRWERVIWEEKSGSDDVPLLVRAGNYIKADWRERCWETPNSLRNVDAACEAIITALYE